MATTNEVASARWGWVVAAVWIGAAGSLEVACAPGRHAEGAAGSGTSSTPDGGRQGEGEGDDEERAGGEGEGEGEGEDAPPPESLGCASEVADGCGEAEVCSDGLDNDCDGRVDDGCSCEHGASQPCFAGPPGRRGVGGCVDGVQVCHGFEFTEWSECEGGASPSVEACDGKDNDCNGCADDIADCQAGFECPVEDSAPPLHEYALEASRIVGYEPSACRWSIDCPLGSTCAGPADPQDCSTLAYLDVSGNYTVTLTFVDEHGVEITCSWIVHVSAAGLRVELSWDGAVADDVDLHLHREAETAWFAGDDCYYSNCSESTGSYSLAWGYEDTPLDECPEPPPGSGWDFPARGGCPNPRLDIDDTEGFGPENVNLDNPAPGDQFRVMAHYYDGGGDWDDPAPGVAGAIVRVYCGGALQAQFGPATIRSAGFGTGDLWRVADVAILEDGQSCTVTPLEREGDYDVQPDDSRAQY